MVLDYLEIHRAWSKLWEIIAEMYISLHKVVHFHDHVYLDIIYLWKLNSK